MGNASLTDQNEWAEWKMKKKAWIKKTAHVIRFVQKATWKKRHFFLSNKRISCFKTIYFVLGTCNAHILLAYCNMSIARLIDSRLKDSVPISVGKRKSRTTHTHTHTYIQVCWYVLLILQVIFLISFLLKLLKMIINIQRFTVTEDEEFHYFHANAIYG